MLSTKSIVILGETSIIAVDCVSIHNLSSTIRKLWKTLT
jgi:hypothetical protein